MSLQGKQSPNSINLLASLMQSTGLNINSSTAGYIGSSTAESNYTAGTMVSGTVLDKLSQAIALAYPVIDAVSGSSISQAVYTSLISIGSSTIPALGNSPASTYTVSYTNSLSRYGFLRTIALQAYNEFVFGTGSYSDFCSSFLTASGYKSANNSVIASLYNANNYLAGVYSNMNDLMTADITGVNQSTVYWGQDLIKSGRAINLATIKDFGLPSNLLRTLKANNALTEPVNIALIYSGLSTTEITGILNLTITPTIDQERKIYGAFTVVVNNDLADVCTCLNTQTFGLVSLADLLNPVQLFPNSYNSLTTVRYNTTMSSTNSKIYYPIYVNGTVNMQLSTFGFGSNLTQILPDDIAIACGAFSTAMLQIKNIQNVEIQKFSQVVTNLEVTTGLTVNGTSTPVNNALATAAYNTVALGGGPYGTYTMADFFGAMSGVGYNLARIQQLITQLQSSTLTTIYNNMYTEMGTSSDHNSAMTTYIAQANAEILAIYNANTAAATELNTLWIAVGTALTKESTIRATALSSSATSGIQTIYSFIDSMTGYAVDTEPLQSVQVLEAIANTSTIGGQALIALLREIRNAQRLGLAGLELDNNISNQLPVTSGNGLGIPKVTGAAQTPGSFAGSPETNLIPQNLDIFNISTAIKPSTVAPNQALQDVIDCYCDCWDNL
jgi:hypothetical protein